MMIRGIECYSSRGVAAMLEIGRNTMLSTLRIAGALTPSNTPTSSYAGRGYFVVESGVYDTLTTYYTPLGIDMVKLLCKDVPRKQKSKYKETELDYDMLDI